MNLRNVAIIAHVDHGKTTLVDRLLQQSGTYRENQKVTERAMDSNDLERERGITILAKAASVQWKDTRINIVDTPGHADFGGEVERILNMVDGALVLVDAAEGPLPQTKFVVSKALKVGLKPIVVINKVDRPDARPTEVINEVFDLFAALDASEEQLDFPILYGSAKQGWMADSPDGSQEAGMQPLFDLIVRHVAPPTVEEGPFRMIGTILEANPYLGRIITGRITSGSIKPNQAVKVLGADGKTIEQGRITKILAFRGIDQHQRAIHHVEDALDLAAEIGVAGGIDDVDAGVFPLHRGRLGQNGDAALALQVVGVHHPLLHVLVGRERAGLLQELVDEGGLAMVDVCDDGDVAQLHR